MWYVYILQSVKDGYTYVGLTNDIEERVRDHHRGSVFSTAPRRPFELVYYEAHLNKHDAAHRERFLKTGWGKQWIKRTLKRYFESKKLGG